MADVGHKFTMVPNTLTDDYVSGAKIYFGDAMDLAEIVAAAG